MKNSVHPTNRYLYTPESGIPVVLHEGCRRDCGMGWLTGHQGSTLPPALSHP